MALEGMVVFRDGTRRIIEANEISNLMMRRIDFDVYCPGCGCLMTIIRRRYFTYLKQKGTCADKDKDTLDGVRLFHKNGCPYYVTSSGKSGKGNCISNPKKYDPTTSFWRYLKQLDKPRKKAKPKEEKPDPMHLKLSTPKRHEKPFDIQPLFYSILKEAEYWVRYDPETIVSNGNTIGSLFILIPNTMKTRNPNVHIDGVRFILTCRFVMTDDIKYKLGLDEENFATYSIVLQDCMKGKNSNLFIIDFPSGEMRSKALRTIFEAKDEGMDYYLVYGRVEYITTVQERKIYNVDVPSDALVKPVPEDSVLLSPDPWKENDTEEEDEILI